MGQTFRIFATCDIGRDALHREQRSILMGAAVEVLPDRMILARAVEACLR
jgi:hypothetical protein